MTNLPENWEEYLKKMSEITGGGCGIMGCEGDDRCIFQSTALYMLAHPGSLPDSEITLRLSANVHKKNCRAHGMSELGEELKSVLGL